MPDLERSSASAQQTQGLGERLGRVLQPGDVIALEGELGAGKTCFVQGLARGLGVPAERRIASPSFTLVNEHPGRLTLYHADLYRLEDPGELDEIGLAEYLEAGGVTVVEWFSRFADLLPPERIDVRLEITGPEARRMIVSARGAAAADRVRRWRDQLEAG